MKTELKEKLFNLLEGKTFSVDFNVLFPDLPPFGPNHKVTVVMLSTLYSIVQKCIEENEK